MAPSRSADAVGRVLGDRYRLTRPLGAGASAYVFVADDVVLRRRVAVKVLHPGLADDEGFLRRFRAEAQVVASLRHPNILRVYDWGDDDGSPFIVMELLEGGSLRAMLDRGHLLTPAQAAGVGIEAARALDYAHSRGLVHRDIKPANLIFDDVGRLSVADFGLARALAEATWTEPSSAVVGTARYAAPEQAMGRSLDDKADVYSLALVLVEAMTGSVPFAADTTIATLMARVEQPLQAPPDAGPLRAAIDAAGAVDPGSRPGARVFAEALATASARMPPPAPLLLSREPVERLIDLDADPTDYPGRPRLFDRAVVDEDRASASPAPSNGAETVAGNLGGAQRGARVEPRLEPRPERPAPRADRTGKRARRVVLAIVLLAILAGAAAAAVALSKAMVPSHPVPSLVGDTQAKAQAALSPLHFHLRVVGREYGNRPAGRISTQRPDSGRLDQGSTISIVLSLGPRPVAVPAIPNLPEAQAAALVHRAGLKLAVSARRASMTVAKNSVISATPTGGTLLPGQVVSVVVSTGKPTVPVPDLTGPATASFSAAQAALGRVGLHAIDVQQFSNTVAPGAVIGTVPAPGTTVVVGTEVTVDVSKGPQLFPVPDVRGDPVTAASQALTAQGFTVSGVSGNPTAMVTGTYPAAGSLLRAGAAVEIITG